MDAAGDDILGKLTPAQIEQLAAKMQEKAVQECWQLFREAMKITGCRLLCDIRSRREGGQGTPVIIEAIPILQYDPSIRPELEEIESEIARMET